MVMTEPGEQPIPHKEPAKAVPPSYAGDDLDDDEDLVEPGTEVKNSCRCGECCRRLIVEVGTEDAEREPKIKERCEPIYAPPELTKSGQRNSKGTC